MKKKKLLSGAIVLLEMTYVALTVFVSVILFEQNFLSAASKPEDSEIYASESTSEELPTEDETSATEIASTGTGSSKPSGVITEPQDVKNDYALFELSKTGKNVIVIMIDRGMNEYLPYIMNEHPELYTKLSGFTYYPNTMGFGSNTNFAVPALLGGYEYTPVELNKRSSEKLVTKHNEALCMLPVLFTEHGYQATLCEPVYANYKWTPDLTLFDQYPKINAYLTKGEYGADGLPLTVNNKVDYGEQTTDGKSKASGIDSTFMNSYNALCALPTMTQITNKKKNTYLFFANETAHDPIILKEPECVPAWEVDNTQYDEEHADRFTLDGVTLRIRSATHMAHYQTNIAVLLKLGDWFDYMKKNGVYDNTRIIITSDHGRGFTHLSSLVPDSSDNNKTIEWYYPLLMFKDFNSTEFTTSNEFMTNADVPYMAVNGLIDNPRNPFTGKLITNQEKYAHDQYVILSMQWRTNVNNGKTFLPARWARVKNNNMLDKNNWEFYDEEIVLDEHRFPNDPEPETETETELETESESGNETESQTGTSNGAESQTGTGNGTGSQTGTGNGTGAQTGTGNGAESQTGTGNGTGAGTANSEN